MAQELTRADVESAFREVGEALVRARKVAEVAVFGGAAIMLQFEVEFRTQDVDVRVEGGDHGALLRATHAVADRRGWLRSWFSEAVVNYVGDAAASLSFHASYPSETRVGLRVYLAKPDYLLAMKLRAMRVGSRDEADAAMLARATGVVEPDALLALFRRYFPREPPGARLVTVVRRFAEALRASPPPDAG